LTGLFLIVNNDLQSDVKIRSLQSLGHANIFAGDKRKYVAVAANGILEIPVYRYGRSLAEGSHIVRVPKLTKIWSSVLGWSLYLMIDVNE
jgi:hypothetical protein